MTVTIRDVAKEAKVSVSAASKALNDYPDISEETKKEVRKTAKRLGYVANQSAKNLSSKSQKNVAILLSSFLEEVQVDDYVMNMMKGAARYLSEHQISAAIYAINSEIQEKKSLSDFCHEYSLSGVLLFGLKMNDRYVQEASCSKIPCVGVDYNISGSCTAAVKIDDCEAFEKITEYVLERNHKEIVLVYGRESSQVSQERYRGFCKALHKVGIDEKNVTILYTDFKEENAYIETLQFIKKYSKKKATVFVCMSDMLAMGVYRAIKECGYVIPEDFSVTGFDGLGFLGFVEPKLSTVDQNGCGKGYEAGRLLERLVNGERDIEQIMYPYQIVEGNSIKII